MLKILFAGTPDVAVPSLRTLAADSEHFEVVAVLTRPDAPTGRGRKLTPSPVKTAALELGLPVLESDPAEPTFLDELKVTGAQAAAVIAYGRILKQSVLDALRLVQPAFLAAAALAWRGPRATSHLVGRRYDRHQRVPHHASDGCRPAAGAIRNADRRA